MILNWRNVPPGFVNDNAKSRISYRIPHRRPIPKVEISPIRLASMMRRKGLGHVRSTRLRRLERSVRFCRQRSHELRTPLTPIKGFIETLLDGVTDSRETTKRFHHYVRDRPVEPFDRGFMIVAIESGQAELNHEGLPRTIRKRRLTLQEQPAEKISVYRWSLALHRSGRMRTRSGGAINLIIMPLGIPRWGSIKVLNW